jgi:phosphatidate cytidylyltransferase
LIRILTATVLLAILAGTLLLPPIAFVVVLALFLLLGWHEYAGLAAEAGAAPLRGLGAPLAAACAASFAAPDPHTPVVVFGLALLSCGVTGLVAGSGHPALAVRRAVSTAAGICWLGLLPGFYVALRYEPHGVALIVLLFAAVSSGDIAAYYGGKALGRHPLAPQLSPKKTIEGTVCGLLASGTGAAVVTHYWLQDTTWWRGLVVGVVLGAVGQAGDLFESSLKRAAEAKDSSGILPGHGGILDRLDGLLFAGAALYAAVFFGLL